MTASPLRYALPVLSVISLAACVSSDPLPPAPRTVDMSGAPLPPEPSMPEAMPHRKTGNPYKVAGVWYYPAENEDYDVTGIGSWYGPKFHGKRTANGEIFDMTRLTAAHPTLPLPSLAKVTNLANGRETVVRINDRGPFADGRIIDLSRAAADKLGYREDGLAELRVTWVGEASMDDAVTALNQNGSGMNWQLAGGGYPDTVRTRIASGPEIVLDEAIRPGDHLDATMLADARAHMSEDGRERVQASGIKPPAHGAIPAATVAVSLPRETPQYAPEGISGDSAAPDWGAGTAQFASGGDTQAVDTAVAAPSGRLMVQVAAFSNMENLDRSIARFEGDWPVRQNRIERNGRYLYRLRLGPFASNNEAELARIAANDRGFPDARIVVID